MTTPETALAEQSNSFDKTEKPVVVEGLTLRRMPMKENQLNHPVVFYQGKEPHVGTMLQFTLDNGTTYQGKVADATETGGEVMVEFTEKLTILPR